MESPDSTDAQSYTANLKLLGELMPAMPAPARSRAAWNIARSKMNLADAVRAEGFDLHGAAAPTRTVAPDARRAAPRSESERIDLAARELQKRNPSMSYREAVVAVSKVTR